MRALRPGRSRIPTGILEYFLLPFGDAGSAQPQRPHRRKTSLPSPAAVIFAGAWMRDLLELLLKDRLDPVKHTITIFFVTLTAFNLSAREIA
jgi:hypothetical protein